MRTFLWLVRMVLRRLVTILIGLVIWMIFGRSRTGRRVRTGINLLRRFARF